MEGYWFSPTSSGGECLTMRGHYCLPIDIRAGDPSVGLSGHSYQFSFFLCTYCLYLGVHLNMTLYMSSVTLPPQPLDSAKMTTLCKFRTILTKSGWMKPAIFTNQPLWGWGGEGLLQLKAEHKICGKKCGVFSHLLPALQTYEYFIPELRDVAFVCKFYKMWNKIKITLLTKLKPI